MTSRSPGLPVPRIDAVWAALGALVLVAAATAAIEYSGTRAVVLLVGAVAFGLLVWNPQATVCLLVFASAIEGALRSAPGGDSVPAIKALAAALILGFVLHALTRRMTLHNSTSLMIVVLILVLALASTTMAGVTSDAVSVLFRYVGFVAAFVVISELARSNRMLEAVAWSFALGATTAAVIGLSRFVLGYYGPVNLPDSDKNDVAFTLVVALPVILWLIRGPRVQRMAVGAMAALTTAALLLTTSRGGLVGISAMILWYIVTERRHVIKIVGGVLAALILTVGVVSLNQSAFDQVLTHREYQAGKNVDSRFEAWRGAIDLAVGNPVLGVGPGNFRHEYLAAVGAPIGSHPLSVAHNTYLDVSAELGIIAGLLFCLLLVVAFAYLTRARLGERGPPGLATALRVSLVGAVASGSFLSEQYFIWFWLLAALATAILAAPVTAPAPAQASR